MHSVLPAFRQIRLLFPGLNPLDAPLRRTGAKLHVARSAPVSFWNLLSHLCPTLTGHCPKTRGTLMALGPSLAYSQVSSGTLPLRPLQPALLSPHASPGAALPPVSSRPGLCLTPCDVWSQCGALHRGLAP